MKVRFWFALLLLLTSTRTARAGERLAVLLAADGDRSLADNLTEVVIARVAERPGYELVGVRELRAQLASIIGSKSLGECFSHSECLSRLGRAAEAERAIVGRVRRAPHAFELWMALVETKTAVEQAQVSRTISPDVIELIATAQRSVDELLDRDSASNAPHTEPKQPLPGPQEQQSRPLDAIATPLAVSLPAPPTSWNPPNVENPAPDAVRSHVSYVGIGAASLAVVAIAGAAVTGVIATSQPVGSTRSAAQDDLERRKNFATAANGLWIAGGALGALSAMAFVWRW